MDRRRRRRRFASLSVLTMTLVAIVSARAVPRDAAAGHFLSYKAQAAKGTAKFVRRTVNLVGDFEDVSVDVKAVQDLFVPVAAALFAGSAALLFVFWLGRTALTLAFAATERVCAVRGRNPLLFQFADSVADQLAARGNGRGA